MDVRNLNLYCFDPTYVLPSRSSIYISMIQNVTETPKYARSFGTTALMPFEMASYCLPLLLWLVRIFLLKQPRIGAKSRGTWALKLFLCEGREMGSDLGKYKAGRSRNGKKRATGISRENEGNCATRRLCKLNIRALILPHDSSAAPPARLLIELSIMAFSAEDVRMFLETLPEEVPFNPGRQNLINNAGKLPKLQAQVSLNSQGSWNTLD